MEQHMTAQDLARAYVVAINSPANGWWQHVHPTQGRSDYIMLRLRQLVGEDECDRLIDEAIAERRADV